MLAKNVVSHARNIKYTGHFYDGGASEVVAHPNIFWVGHGLQLIRPLSTTPHMQGRVAMRTTRCK